MSGVEPLFALGLNRVRQRASPARDRVAPFLAAKAASFYPVNDEAALKRTAP